MSSPASLEPVLLVLALVVLFLVRRAYQMVVGAPVRPARLFVLSAVYVGLFALTVGASVGITPEYYFALDGALLVLASFLATRYIREHVHLERRPPSSEWFYRLHPWVPIVYIGLFVVRIGVAIAVLGPNAFAFTPVARPSLPPIASGLLVLVDALFAISTGILVGRSFGVYLAYERVRGRAADPTATGPLPGP